MTENEKKYIPRHHYDVYKKYKNRPKPPIEEDDTNFLLDLKFSPMLVLLLTIWFLIVAIGSIFVGAMD